MNLAIAVAPRAAAVVALGIAALGIAALGVTACSNAPRWLPLAPAAAADVAFCGERPKISVTRPLHLRLVLEQSVPESAAQKVAGWAMAAMGATDREDWRFEVAALRPTLRPLQGAPGEDAAWTRLGQVLRRCGGGPQDVLVLVMNQHLVAGSEASRGLADAHGLAVSETGMHEAAMRPLRREFPRPVPPFVLLGLEPLAKAPSALAVGVVGHELGHALGLPHTASPANMMGPPRSNCVPGWSEEQRRALLR